MSPPSQLPRAEEFVGDVFDLLTCTGRILLDDRSALDDVRIRIQEKLRLEIFLEALAAEIPDEIVFSPFQKFHGAEPNFTHCAVVVLASHTIMTTNQDLLLEDAARRLGMCKRILHFHGKCDDILSIATTISQYLGGLEKNIRNLSRRKIEDANLVVIGYSGRDLDIMPLLENGRPRLVNWILHTDSPISPELKHAQTVLGSRLNLVRANTADWLAGHLSSDELSHIDDLVRPLSPKPLHMPPDVEASFRDLGLAHRNRALAKVLEHLGRYREALKIYSSLRRLASETLPGCARLVIDLARVTARTAGHDAARELLSPLLRRTDLPPAMRGRALLADLDALRNSSRAAEAAQRLDDLGHLLKVYRSELRREDKMAYWHLRGWSLSARAGIHRIEGRPKTARRLYGDAEHAFSRARDIDGRIEVRTWGAETAIILGELRSAIALADAATQDSVAYAKDLVRGWSSYVRAEALALSGYCDEALKELQNANEILESGGNKQGPLWCMLLKSDCLREADPHEANAVLDEVRNGLRGLRLAHVQARLYLEEAEIARAVRSWPAVNKAIAALRIHIEDERLFTRRPPILMAHASLVEAECARDKRDADAVKLLAGARQRYQRIGAQVFVARASVALFLAGHLDGSDAALLADCRDHGYGHEVARLEKTKTGFYPIHFV